MVSSSYAPLPISDSDSSLDLTMDDLLAEPQTLNGEGDVRSSKTNLSVEPASISALTRFRSSYYGALIFNVLAFLIPAVYGTLSKMWIANIDSSLVSTTDAYTYFSVLVEVLNEGLPRAAWSTIGRGDPMLLPRDSPLDHFSFRRPFIRWGLCPGENPRDLYRILAFDSFASTLNTAVSLGTRALDKPDVPLLMSSAQTLIQIFLELALVSTVHVRGFNPTIHTIATIKIVCDLAGAAIGLAYFLYLARKATAQTDTRALKWFSYPALKELFLPGRWTFTESAVRNAIYLWQIHGVVSMGQAYATAWGVFNTIRWGLIMVPVNALEATSNTFVGHRWGIYQSSKPTPASRPSWIDIRFVTAPAFRSVLIALLVEVPMCIALSIRGAGPFARYLSNSDEVADITAKMWKSIDWCYICYAVSTQLATILLATQTRWYLYQSLMSNIFYALPWAIALPRIGITPETAWTYHKWVFGGSLVVSLGIIIAVDSLWAIRLCGWRSLNSRS